MSLIFHNRPDLSWHQFEDENALHRILNANKYIELLPSIAYSELNLQAPIVDHLRLILKNNYYVFPYGSIFYRQGYTNIGGHAPDLIIVRKDLKRWYIVEVEMSDHGLSHMTKQLLTFSNPDLSSPEPYANSMYKKIHAQDPFFTDKSRVLDMISIVKNDTVLISDHIPVKWRNDFEKKMKIHYVTFQAYNDEHNHRFYRFNDMLLFEIEMDFAYGKYYHVGYILEFFQNRTPTFRNCNVGDIVTIYHQGYRIPWQVSDNGTVLRLIYTGGGVPLPSATTKVKLTETATGKLLIETYSVL